MKAPPVPLLFAFPDGVFHYVCAECDALCCRGQGFAGSMKREMPFLLKQYPFLNAAVTTRRYDVVDISTPAGRCFFLNDDRLCRIETDHGRERKPGVCVVFPFNAFYALGTSVIVTPHFLCPLRIHVPAKPGEVAGTHAMLEGTIRQSGMLDPQYVRRVMTTIRLPKHASAPSVIAREEAFRNRCQEVIGRATFMEFLSGEVNDSRQLAEFRRRVIKLMAWQPVTPSRSPDSIDNVMIAIASKLRVESLRLDDAALVRTLCVSETLVRSLFPKTFPPAAQAIYDVVHSAAPLLRTLAQGDAPIALRKKPMTPNFGSPELTFAAYMAHRDVQRVGVLDALGSAFGRLTTAADRSTLAHYLSSQVDPAI